MWRWFRPKKKHVIHFSIACVRKTNRIVKTICKAAVLTIVGKPKRSKSAMAPVPFERQQPVVTVLSIGDRMKQHCYCLLAKLQIEHDIAILDC
jgi:hypothetical protein